MSWLLKEPQIDSQALCIKRKIQWYRAARYAEIFQGVAVGKPVVDLLHQ
jgi:hypothetical protein